MITKRPARLSGVSYVGYQRYLLTSVTDMRHPAFSRADTAARSIEQLQRSGTRHGFAVIADRFMPDHVHVLAYGTSPHSDFREFVAHFKKLTGFDYSKRRGRRLWQPGYHERMLRDDEATDAVARYVLANPVRAGLASFIGEYPFAGSDLYDLKAMLTAWDRQG